MKSKALWLGFVCAALLASAMAQKVETSNRTWITDVYIVSPENLDHIEKGSVLIEDGRIAQVDHNAHAKAPAGATIIDGGGQFLIPGLIDSHVHVASVPGLDFDQEGGKNQAMVDTYFRQMPRSYLYYGYTTLIDLAVYDPPVMAEFRGSPLHPDLYDCGGSLPEANGYPMSYVPSPLRFQAFPNFLYDPKQADHIPAEFKPEDHTAAADVARVKASGGICVKTYFERGFDRDRNLPVIRPEMIAQVRKAATDAGLVLMMHANSLEAQKFAVAGNVDVMAHGLWNWGEVKTGDQLPDEIRHVLDEVIAKKMGYQPTMQVLYGLQAYFDPEYLKNPAIAKVVPKALIDWFETPEGKWFGKELNDDNSPDATVLAHFENGPVRRVRQVVAYLASKKAKLLFGTDTPSGPTYGNLPGLNGYMEMKQWQKAGVPLRQIFLAATLRNALEFKLDSQVGTIEPGKIANLVLLKKSPLETVEAYDTISTVWIHGKQVERQSLAADSKQ